MKTAEPKLSHPLEIIIQIKKTTWQEIFFLPSCFCEQTCLQKMTPYSHVDYISFHVGLSLRLL